MIISCKYILIASACFLGCFDTSFAVMDKSLKLELVQVNFRHGIRTPSQSEARYVNVTDPTIYEPHGFEQLTNDGKYQAYKLGLLLRKQYDEFLGNYDPDQLHAYSSGYDRTKMTLQLVLAGLYPPSEEDKWHPTLNWRPIPFGSARTKVDVLCTPHSHKKYSELFNVELGQSKHYKEEMAKYEELLDFMEKMTGVSFRRRTIFHSGYTHYVVKIHKLMNLPLPDWAYDDEIVGKIRDIFKFHLDMMSATTKLKKLNGGTMVRQVIENIEKNRDAEKPKKLYLYSHHDLTLAAFERAQGIKVFDIPPFGSAVVLEKYRSEDGVEYVRFLAWNGEDDGFYPVQVNGQEFYPFADYLKLVQDSIPTDEDLAYLVSAE